MSVLLPAITTGAQLLGHAYEKYQSNKANEMYRDALDKRQSDLEGMFNQEYYKDPLQTQGAQSAIGLMSNRLKEQNQDLRDSAVRTGQTAQAQTAQKEQGQEQMNELVNSLVQGGQARKQNTLNNYMRQKSYLGDKEMQYLNQKRQDWGRFGSNVSGTASSVLDAYAQGVFD